MLKTVLFDLYRTLIDITTDEGDPGVYVSLARFLAYRDVRIDADGLQSALREGVERAISESREKHPETDVFKVFGAILTRYGGKKFDPAVVTDVAMLYRSLSMRNFGLFPGVTDLLTVLQKHYGLGLVSDAQWVYANPEIAMLGLDRFFDVRVISSLLGFKKPDPRMFALALEELNATVESSVYIGDDPERDLIGAHAAGMRCLLFRGAHQQYHGLVPDGVFEDYGELPELLAAL